MHRGWLTVLLFAPHLLLGAWLRIVPDGRMFGANQAVVLVHVAVALFTLPVAVVTFLQHTRGLGPVLELRASLRRLTRTVVTLAALAAFGTGVVALWSGSIGWAGGAHAFFGFLPALPLGVHLLLEGRAAASLTGVALVALTPLSMSGFASSVRLKEPEVVRPSTAFQTVDSKLYDTTAWCGECHVDQYAEWSRSTHGHAMTNPHVRKLMTQHVAETGLDSVDSDTARKGPNGDDACVKCHAPTTFFGDDPRPALQAEGIEKEAISCGFCHTIDGVSREGRGPVYVSAPNADRRYLWQNAASGVERTLGNLLIRWRPEVHSKEYHRPILDTSMACVGCHQSFFQWEETTFAGSQRRGPPGSHPPANAPVNCQDCHMARRPTGEAVREPGRLVPWGPERPQKRNHWFRGGNVAAALEVGDDAFAALEREARQGTLSMKILGTRREPGGVAASVAIRSQKIGHRFPTGEGGQRSLWLMMAALSADGKELASSGTPAFRFSLPKEEQERVTSIELDQKEGDGPAVSTRNAVPPESEKVYEIHLKLDAGTPVDRLAVRVRSNFDPLPYLEQTTPLPAE